MNQSEAQTKALSYLIHSPVQLGFALCLLLEFILLDLELDCILAREMIGMDNNFKLKSLERVKLLSSAGWLNPLTQFSNLRNTSIVWVMLFGIGFVLLGAVYWMLRFRPERHRLNSFFKGVLFTYGYLFYYITYICFSFADCSSTLKLRRRFEFNSDGIVLLESSVIDLDKSLELYLKRSWLMDKNKICFQGEYIMALMLNVVVLGLNLAVKLCHNYITAFHPRIDILDSIGSYGEVVQIITTFMILLLKYCILTFGLTNMVGVYYWVVLTMNFMGLISHVAVKQANYFNDSFNRLRILRAVLKVAFSCILLTVRQVGLPASPDQLNILVILTCSLCVKLVWLIKIEELGISDTQCRKLVYDFERLKLLIAQNKDSGLEERNRILLKISQLEAQHRKTCLDIQCACHDRESYLYLTRANKILSTSEGRPQENLYLLEQVAVINRILSARMSSFHRANDVASKSFLRSFQLWMLFNVDNICAIHKGISMLGALLLRSAHEGPKKFVGSRDLEVLKSVLELKYPIIIRKGVPDVWRKLIRFKDEVFEISNNIVKVLRFVYETKKTSRALAETSKFKLDSLRSIFRTSSTEELFDIGKKYQSLVKSSDAQLKVLVDSGFEHNRVTLTKVFFDAYVKEDIEAAKRELHDLKGRYPSKASRRQDMGGAESNSITTITSFETGEFHTIKYATTNIKQLGFSLKHLLGCDLDLLISNSVAAHHKVMCMAMMKSNEYVGRVTGIETYVRDADGKIRLASVYYRLYPHLREGLQFAGKLDLKTLRESSENDMVLMLDSSCRVQDVCQIAAEKFALESCISSFSQEIFCYIRFIDQRSRTEASFVSSEEMTQEDKETQELHKMAVGFLGQWLPLTAQGCSYLIKLTRVVVSVVNSAAYVLHLRPAKQTASKEEQSIFVSMMKRHNDSLFNAIASVPKVDEQILQYVRRVLSSASVNQSVEEKKVIALKKFTRREKVTQKILTAAKIEEDGQTTLRLDLDRPDLKHSRFIHHNINFKGIKPLLSAIVLPLILLCIAVVSLMEVERQALAVFSKIDYDVTARDSESYMVWGLLLHVQHNELRRFVLQGNIPEDIFQDFGIDHLSSHLYALTSNGFADQLYSNLLRMHRAIYNSSYLDLYDMQAHLSATLTVKRLNSLDQSVETAQMSVLSATKYSQQILNVLHLTENILDFPQEEEIARFNLLNPIAQHFLGVVARLEQQSIFNAFLSIAGLTVFCFYFLMCTVHIKRKTSKLTSIIFDFDVNSIHCQLQEAEVALAYTDSLYKNFNEFLKYESLDILKEQQIKAAKLSKELASEESLPQFRSHSKQDRKDRKFRLTKKPKQVLPFGRPLFLLLFSFVLLAVVSLARYFVMRLQSRSNMTLSIAVGYAAELYLSVMSINLSLVELIRTDNREPIMYMSPEDYYRKNSRLLKSTVDRFKQIVSTDDGKASKIIDQFMNSNMCDVFKSTVDTNEYYKNCSIAMAGIANDTMNNFLTKYSSLGDDLIQNWRAGETLEERIQVLKKPQFASMIAYSFYNVFGTADSLYYSTLIPILSVFKAEIGKIGPVINLTNIISILAFILFSGSISIYLLFSTYSILASIGSVIYVVPLRLIDSSTLFKDICRKRRPLVDFFTL